MKMKALFLTCLMTGLLSMGAVAFAASSVSGDKVEYDFKSGQAVAEGNVEIRHDKGRATARKAEYNTKTGEGSLEGSVVADQEDAHLTSASLIIKNKGDYLSAIGNAVLKRRTRPCARSRSTTTRRPNTLKLSAAGPSSPWMMGQALTRHRLRITWKQTRLLLTGMYA